MELYQIFVVLGFIGWLLAGQWAQSKRTNLADSRADTHERQIDELDRRLNDHARKRKHLKADLTKDIQAIENRLDREDDYQRERREIEDANR